MQLNLESFYWLYQDYQFTFINFATNGTQALADDQCRQGAALRRQCGHHSDADKNRLRSSLTAEYLSTRFWTSPIRRRLPWMGGAVARHWASQVRQHWPMAAARRSSVRLFRRGAGACHRSGRSWARGRATSCCLEARKSWRPSMRGTARPTKLDVTAVDFLTQEILHDLQRGRRLSQRRWPLVGDRVDQEHFRNRAVFNDARRVRNELFLGRRHPSAAHFYGVRLNYELLLSRLDRPARLIVRSAWLTSRRRGASNERSYSRHHVPRWRAKSVGHEAIRHGMMEPLAADMDRAGLRRHRSAGEADPLQEPTSAT